MGQTWVDRILKVIERHKALNPSRATIEDIHGFERQHDVSIPDDWRDYFMRVNGTAGGQYAADGPMSYGFWHLGQLQSLASDEHPDKQSWPDRSRWFHFSDYLIWSWSLIVQFPARPGARASVALDNGRRHTFINGMDGVVDAFEQEDFDFLAGSVEGFHGEPNHPMLRHLRYLCGAADDEFERGRRLHGARIKCAAGCSSCCSQIFQITEVEAARISAWVSTLPPVRREELQLRARANLRVRAALFDGGEEWGSTVPRGQGTPCPALTPEGACGMYEARPIMCRKFGVPIWNPDKPENVMACELNFADGEAIDDPHLVDNQFELFKSQKDLQAKWNEEGGGRDDKPWCIARAIVEDATKFLP